ncbi:MAG TPA: hypothetical protein VIP46_02785 [Pyrinomonadaceae bacterium]
MLALSKQAYQRQPARPRPRPLPPSVVTKREGLELCRQFYDEMCEFKLTVHQKPDPDRNNCCGVRYVGVQNPRWYQEFCRQYSTRRGTLSGWCDSCGWFHRRGGRHRRGRPRRGRKKHDTLIKRRETMSALLRILEGGTETIYTERLREFIRRRGKSYLKR